MQNQRTLFLLQNQPNSSSPIGVDWLFWGQQTGGINDVMLLQLSQILNHYIRDH